MVAMFGISQDLGERYPEKLTTNFGDNSNTTLTYGFSTDGVNFDLGTAVTLIEGTDIFSPDNGTVLASTSVSYAATGSESAIYLMLARTGGNTGRSVATISTSDLTFVVPEPSSYALLAGLTGLAFAMVRRRK